MTSNIIQPLPPFDSINANDSLDPDRLMTPKRYFEEKKKLENPIIIEEDETNEDELKKEKQKTRKHVRKALPRYIQKENLVIAASKGYHIFYDEVN